MKSLTKPTASTVKLNAITQALGFSENVASKITDCLIALHRNPILNLPALTTFINYTNQVTKKKFNDKQLAMLSNQVELKAALHGLARAKTTEAVLEAHTVLKKAFKLKVQTFVKPLAAKMPATQTTVKVAEKKSEATSNDAEFRGVSSDGLEYTVSTTTVTIVEPHANESDTPVIWVMPRSAFSSITKEKLIANIEKLCKRMFYCKTQNTELNPLMVQFSAKVREPK